MIEKLRKYYEEQLRDYEGFLQNLNSAHPLFERTEEPMVYRDSLSRMAGAGMFLEQIGLVKFEDIAKLFLEYNEEMSNRQHKFYENN